MPMHTIISSRKAAATATLTLGQDAFESRAVGTQDSPSIPVMVYAWGLGDGEYVDILVEDDSGNWINLKKDGVNLRLSSDDNYIGLFAPGHYQFSKDATAADSGVGCSRVRGLAVN